jgi:hypothetical protein
MKSKTQSPGRETTPLPSQDLSDPKIDTTDSIPPLSQRKKWSLLMVFCLGFFIDIWMYSAFLYVLRRGEEYINASA